MGGKSRAEEQVDVCPVRLSAHEPNGAVSAAGPGSVSQGSAPGVAGPRSSQHPKTVWDSRPPAVAVNGGWGCRPRSRLGAFSVLKPKGQKDGHRGTEEMGGHWPRTGPWSRLAFRSSTEDPQPAPTAPLGARTSGRDLDPASTRLRGVSRRQV